MKFKIAEMASDEVMISKDNVVRETDKAILINDGSFDAWIPKSQITRDEKFAFYVPRWLMDRINTENQATRNAWGKRGK